MQLCSLPRVDGSLVFPWRYDLGNGDGLSSLTELGGDLSVIHSNCGNAKRKGLGSVKRAGGNFEVEVERDDRRRHRPHACIGTYGSRERTVTSKTSWNPRSLEHRCRPNHSPPLQAPESDDAGSAMA